MSRCSRCDACQSWTDLRCSRCNYPEEDIRSAALKFQDELDYLRKEIIVYGQGGADPKILAETFEVPEKFAQETQTLYNMGLLCQSGVFLNPDK